MSDREQSECHPGHFEEDSFPRDIYLYNGSLHTQFSAYSMTMLFVLKHSLSNEAFRDLLLLISSLIPKDSHFTTSVYSMKESLMKCIAFKEPIKHCYCKNCHAPIPNGIDRCAAVSCSENVPKLVEFYDLRMEDQIRDFFRDPKFLEMIKQRNEMGPRQDSTIQDIYDGSEYAASLQRRYDRGKGCLYLTFTMNTDGVSLFSSSKKGNLWPVYLAINELPIKLRFSRKYLIPCLLHCETDKPNMLTYLKPLMYNLQKLDTEGIAVETHEGKIRVKAQLLLASLDLPARALVSNMKQFNGRFGCSICFDEGSTLPGHPLQRFYPYNDSMALRSHQHMVRDVTEALRSGPKSVVNGVKGASPLVTLSYADLPKMFAVDWMHSVLLGVTKQLLGLWLDSRHRGKEFFIGNKIDLLNERLLAIKIPDFVSRCQRSLSEYKHWKATECREWLLHFSVPVLNGVAEPKILLHYALLVSAMSLLSSESIKKEDIIYAEQMLGDFCKIFPDIYGVTSQTMNVHLLRHLSHFVLMYGPLFVFSCFGFESMNSCLKNMVHGTRYINSQISFAVGIAKCLSCLVEELITTGSDDSIKKLAVRLGGKYIRQCILTTALGKMQKMERDHADFQTIRNQLLTQDVHIFYRLCVEDGIYYSKEYQETKARNSYCVMYKEQNRKLYGVVNYFVKAAEQYYAATIL